MTPSEPPEERRRIAYIKRGLFSHSNQRTLEQLREHFPEYEVEEIDVVSDLLAHRKLVVAINLFHVWRRYWRLLLFARFTTRHCFYATPYLFGKLRELLRSHLARNRERYVFSLQTQSLFDGSLPGLPHFVYTDHTHLTNLLYPAFPRKNLFTRDWIDLEREIYGHAAHVFVMGEHVRRSLEDHYGRTAADSTCVLAGSNIETAPLSLQNGNYSNRTIVFVGVDWERKGGPTLLRAFFQVLKTIPEAKLIIVGCAPAVKHPQIEVIGRMSRTEVKNQLVRGSVFCLPTRLEPFGIAAVEAFFHRLPVVATALGALPSLVQHGESGLLVPPDDPQALAAALEELLNDPEKCRRFAEFGYATVTAEYTWPAVGRKMRAGILTALRARET